MRAAKKHLYHSTESKYKGGAHDMFVVYDFEQKTRSDGTALHATAESLAYLQQFDRRDGGALRVSLAGT